MKRQSKKALYESIMRDVAKTVKRHLNEQDGLSNRDLIKKNRDSLNNPAFSDRMNRFMTEVLPTKSSDVVEYYKSVTLRIAEIIRKKSDAAALEFLSDLYDSVEIPVVDGDKIKFTHKF